MAQAMESSEATPKTKARFPCNVPLIGGPDPSGLKPFASADAAARAPPPPLIARVALPFDRSATAGNHDGEPPFGPTSMVRVALVSAPPLLGLAAVAPPASAARPSRRR